MWYLVALAHALAEIPEEWGVGEPTRKKKAGRAQQAPRLRMLNARYRGGGGKERTLPLPPGLAAPLPFAPRWSNYRMKESKPELTPALPSFPGPPVRTVCGLLSCLIDRIAVVSSWQRQRSRHVDRHGSHRRCRHRRHRRRSRDCPFCSCDDWRSRRCWCWCLRFGLGRDVSASGRDQQGLAWDITIRTDFADAFTQVLEMSILW